MVPMALHAFASDTCKSAFSATLTYSSKYITASCISPLLRKTRNPYYEGTDIVGACLPPKKLQNHNRLCCTFCEFSQCHWVKAQNLKGLLEEYDISRQLLQYITSNVLKNWKTNCFSTTKINICQISHIYNLLQFLCANSLLKVACKLPKCIAQSIDWGSPQ